MRRQTSIIVAITLSLVLLTAPSLGIAFTLRKSLSPKRDEAIAYNYSRKTRETSKAIRKPLSSNVRARKLSQEATAIGQSVTLLPDGSLLLVGGQGQDGPLDTAFIKQATNGQSASVPNSLHRARTRHTATLLPDGTVMILGGIGADGQILDSAELFDPSTQKFELLASGAISPRADHTATLLTDGKVLIAGGISAKGKTLNKAELWSPQAKSAVTLPARLYTPRHSHSATLMADGKVLIAGGKDGNEADLFDNEIFDPDAMQFVPVGNFTEKSDSNPPYVAASLPANGESSVPTDSTIAIRFSKPMRVDTVNSDTITLSSNQRKLAVKVVAAESGRLAFISPLQPLMPHSVYTVALLDSFDDKAQPLPNTYFSFTTVGSDDHEHGSPKKQPRRNRSRDNRMLTPVNELRDGEDWQPDALNPYDNWRSDRAESDWQKLPALQAAPNVTALSGQVLKLNGNPLANVTLQIGSSATRTDSTGRFLLTGISAGRQALLINGASASHGHKLYASFRSGADITDQQTNVLPYTIWLPLVDTKHVVRIPVPTVRETVISTPLIPGLEIRIPKGVRLRARDGSSVSEISITPIPVDRSPLPLPPGTKLFFSPQAHGAAVEMLDGGNSAGIRIIYPNVTGEEAGSRVLLYDYDALKGWYSYGEATVSRDGKQVVPNEGVGVKNLKCTYVMYGPGAPAEGPPDNGCGEAGDPVDLSTGLFVYRQSDLVLPDTIPITLNRTYRSKDTADRPFGKGATNPYDVYLWFSFWSSMDLILPDGSKIHYDPTAITYEHTTTPSPFYKSTLNGQQSTGYDLRLKDGTTYHFNFKTVIGFPFLHHVRVPLQWIEDRNGNRLTIDRDTTPDMRITRITSPNRKWVEFSYDGTSTRISQVRDNIGRTVSYTYDASGRLWKVTNALGGITEYTYDTSHRMLTIKDARGIVYLTNEYDANGRVSKQTQADNTTYQFAYTLNGSGKVTQADVTDPRGNHRVVTFNSSGYILTDTRGCCGGQAHTFERQTGTNLITSVTDSLGRRTEYSYDSVGNVTSVTYFAGTSEAVTTTATYEATFNQMVSGTNTFNHTTTFGYDSKGNLTSITDPLNHQTSIAYNSMGQPTSVTDALNNTTQFSYNGDDLIGVTNPLGQTVTRFQDAGGRLVKVAGALNSNASYEYDAMNRLTKMTDSLQGATLLNYDGNGNLLGVTDARNNAISYSYDNTDRLATRTDSLNRQESYQYDGNGNLTQVTDRKSQTTNYTYDTLDRLTLVTYHDGSTTSYSYDSANRLTQVVDSISGTISYTHNKLDKVLSETTPQGTVTYTYDAIGRRTSMTVPGQSVINYSYDNANRLTQIQQGTSTITIAYDAADRRTSLTQPNGVVTEYSYDAASRLVELTYKKSGVVLGNLTYAYDAVSRISAVGGSFARTDLPQSLATTSYNGANHQTVFGSQTLTYDLNGNLTSDGVNTYTWNARNQMVSISGTGLSANFTYDGIGRRKSKTINSATTSYLYDGVNIVQEQVGGSASANLLMGGLDEVLSRTDATGTISPVTDRLGSAIALTDSTGAVQTSYIYEPFGKAAVSGTANSNSQTYTGREDDGTGLYYYRARYYSPMFQRFISEDPIGLNGGDVNLYAFVHNDPVNSTDPSGLSDRKWVDLGHGWRAGVDGDLSYGDGFEIHLVNPQGKDVGICQGKQGWVGRHGFPDNVRPPNVPEDVMNNLNGVNLRELRRRDAVPPKGTGGPEGNVKRGRYLNGGRTLYSALNAVGMALSILDEYEAREDLEIRGRKNGLTPAQQFYVDSYKAGHPDFYMTPFGPMPNPYRDRRRLDGPMM